VLRNRHNPEPSRQQLTFLHLAKAGWGGEFCRFR
jgi:hypothetical protein